MRCRPRSDLVVPLACLLALAGAGPAAAAPGGGPARAHPRAAARPSWATAAADRGETRDRGRVDARIYLAGRDPAGLAAYARAVSDPADPAYGAFLSPAAARARFGPDTGQVRAVTAWARSAGLRVTATTGRYVAVRGTVPAVERAFGTRLHDYAVAGRTLRAPAGEPSLPAAVAPAVLSVAGLDAAGRALRPDASAAPPYLSGKPCSAYYGEQVATALPPAYGRPAPWALCGYLPGEIRDAYGVAAGGRTGKDVTVAVVGVYAAPGMAGTLGTYAGLHGEPALAAGQYAEDTVPAGAASGCGAVTSWWSEEAMDLEAVHGVAPDASLRYVGAASCADADLIDALGRVVDGRLADIVSASWSEPAEQAAPASVAAYEQLFELGAVEGIGFYFASGDCGDEDPSLPCAQATGSTRAQADYPAGDPWVTAVGGTSLAIGAGGRYRWEAGWGTTAAGLTPDATAWADLPGTFEKGAGGGVTGFGEPAYQRGVVPPGLAGVPRPKRVVPDVAAAADPSTGMLVGLTLPLPSGGSLYFESRHGGTSLACPLFAAVQALAQQARGRPIGFADPAIYQRARRGLFRDVTDAPLGPGTPLALARNDFSDPSNPASPPVSTLHTLGHDGAGAARLRSIPGYDPVTGVGTPTARYVASYSPAGP